MGLRRYLHDLPAYDLLNKLWYWLEWRRWKAGKSLAVPHYLKRATVAEYARRYGLTCMVETGTYFGEMVDANRRRLSRIVSIELDEYLFRRAVKRFSKYGHIEIVQGDSGTVLPRVLETIECPTLFWLDAHYSGGITALGSQVTPILDEILGILRHPVRGHVILVHDARLFDGTDGYPTLQEVWRVLEGTDRRWVVEVKDDILRLLSQDNGPGNGCPRVMAHEQGRPEPLVTIGLPVYNGADHLRQALDSLREQTYRNIEIIVSDNGSTDGTSAICKMVAAQDSRVRYFRHAENRGPYWNFAFVLTQASGPLFMWAAHDDLWDNDWVSGLVQGFKSDTSIAFGRLCKIGPALGAKEDFPELVFSDSKIIRLARYILADEGKGKANLIYGVHDTASLRARALPILEGDWKIAGLDMLIVFRCLEKGRAVSVPYVSFYKRARPVESNKRGIAGFLRALTMWDRLSYVWACLYVAEGLSTKAIIGALLPVIYLQAAFRSARVIVARHQ